MVLNYPLQEDVRVKKKCRIEQTSSLADAASPGPLEKESQWKECEEKFENYCKKAHIGSAGVPLSYVIRPFEEPDLDNTINNNVPQPDFFMKTIYCAPMFSKEYKADCLTVFNLLYPLL